MTFDEAFGVLEAAGAIARAHGFECAPLITRRVLRIELKRGPVRRAVELTEDQLNACGSAAGVRDMVEREVAKACRDRGAAA